MTELAKILSNPSSCMFEPEVFVTDYVLDNQVAKHFVGNYFSREICDFCFFTSKMTKRVARSKLVRRNKQNSFKIDLKMEKANFKPIFTQLDINFE